MLHARLASDALHTSLVPLGATRMPMGGCTTYLSWRTKNVTDGKTRPMFRTTSVPQARPAVQRKLHQYHSQQYKGSYHFGVYEVLLGQPLCQLRLCLRENVEEVRQGISLLAAMTRGMCLSTNRSLQPDVGCDPVPRVRQLRRCVRQ